MSIFHRSLLKGERGGIVGTPLPAEMAIVIAVLIIILAIGIPRFLSEWKVRKETKCLYNLISLAEGKGSPELRCPFSKKQYQIWERSGQEIISCPDPSGHFRTNSHFIRKAGVLQFRQLFPPFAHQPGTEIEVPTGFLSEESTTVSDQGSTVVIQVKKRVFFRYIVGPLLILILATPLAIGLKSALKKEGNGGCLIMLFVILTPLLLILLYRTIHDQRIEITKASRAVMVQDFYLGKIMTKPAAITQCKAGIPVYRTKGYSKFRLVYEEGGKLKTRDLFSFRNEGLGIIAIIHRTLFPEPQ
jgi:hypothetical protein